MGCAATHFVLVILLTLSWHLLFASFGGHEFIGNRRHIWLPTALLRYSKATVPRRYNNGNEVDEETDRTLHVDVVVHNGCVYAINNRTLMQAERGYHLFVKAQLTFVPDHLWAIHFTTSWRCGFGCWAALMSGGLQQSKKPPPPPVPAPHNARRQLLPRRGRPQRNFVVPAQFKPPSHRPGDYPPPPPPAFVYHRDSPRPATPVGYRPTPPAEEGPRAPAPPAFEGYEEGPRASPAFGEYEEAPRAPAPPLAISRAQSAEQLSRRGWEQQPPPPPPPPLAPFPGYDDMAPAPDCRAGPSPFPPPPPAFGVPPPPLTPAPHYWSTRRSPTAPMSRRGDAGPEWS